jgi:hypothetical protein
MVICRYSTAQHTEEREVIEVNQSPASSRIDISTVGMRNVAPCSDEQFTVINNYFNNVAQN